MKAHAWTLALSCGLLAGCGRTPDGFPPPIQRDFATTSQATSPVTFLALGDPDAGAYVVRDIQANIEGDGWRWTHDRPAVRILLNRNDGWKARMEFSFPEPNFRQTGPVTVSFFVNDKLLDKVRYTTPGAKVFERAVPAAWLKAGEEALLSAEIAPPWIAPTDKAHLGFVLYKAGFVR